MKFAICNEIFQGWKVEDVFAYAAEVGYDGVELAPFTIANSVCDISPAQRQHLREAAAGQGIEIVGLHWLLVKPDNLYINHPDVRVRSRTAAYFCELVDFCADMGGTRLVIGSPKQRNILPGVSPDHARFWALETLREAVRRGEQREVTLCLEPLGPGETNFINTAAEALAFVDQLRSLYFKVILDVKAMCTEPQPIPQIIRQAWPHFVHFHANDKNLKGPGFGDVDYGPIAEALQQVGYEGFISVEVFDFQEGPEVIARRSLDYLRKQFASHGQ